MSNCFSINRDNKKAGFTLLETALCMLIGLSLLSLFSRWGRTHILFSNALEKKIENSERIIALVKKLEEMEERLASPFYRRNLIATLGKDSCRISLLHNKEAGIKSRCGLSQIEFQWTEDRMEIFSNNKRDSVYPLVPLRVFIISRSGIEAISDRNSWNSSQICGLLFCFSLSVNEREVLIRIPFIFRMVLCDVKGLSQEAFQ